MKTLSLLFLALFSIHVKADPGDLIQRVYGDIRFGHQSCGLAYISGNDRRLSYQIRQRRVDEVIVKEGRNGAINPGVLVDWRSQEGELQLRYAQLNGSKLMGVERDFSHNDFAVDTSRGRLMRTQTMFTPRGRNTTYWVRGQRVSKEAFEDFLQTEVVEGFIKYICRH